MSRRTAKASLGAKAWIRAARATAAVTGCEMPSSVRLAASRMTKRVGVMAQECRWGVTAMMFMPGPDGLEETPRWWSRCSGLTLACD